jgi:transcriptional regulator with XRE-family HTH domain
MEHQEDIQIRLIRTIREQLPAHVSLVDEIAELLEISNDSAYRRIRGEKPLSLQEVQKLAGTYQISLDDLIGNPSNSVTFRTNFLREDTYSFVDWLKGLLEFTKAASQDGESEAIFILNELSIFHIIQIPEVCAFKLFFWKKSNLDFPGYRELKFRVNDLEEEVARLSEEITRHYVKIPTKEFTTEESLNSILKQVLYYSEAGYFASREDALALCEKLHDLVDHTQEQAAFGYKFPYGLPQVGRDGNFQLFHNDLILADNTILVKAGDHCATYLTSNAINLMQSLDRSFFDYNYAWGRNLLSKSVLISGSAEKERKRFFRILHGKIDDAAGQL